MFFKHFLPILFIMLVGCDYSQPESNATLVNLETENNYVSDVDNLRQTGFLEINQGSIAATWLALKAKPEDSTYLPEENEVAQYETHIVFLSKKLIEDRRMVANRTVQIRDKLANENIHESLLNLLEGLSDVAREGVKGTYSDYCQWYLILRQNKLSHEAAIKEMKLMKS